MLSLTPTGSEFSLSFSGKKWALLRSTCRGTSVVLSSSHCFPSSQLSKKLKIYPSAAQKSIVQAKLCFPSGAQKHREKRCHFLPAGLSSSLQCWCTGPVPDTPLSANWEAPAWCPALHIAGTDAGIPVQSLLPRPKASSAESGWAHGELSISRACSTAGEPAC